MKKRSYKVLVPTDFSEISRHAIAYVLSHFNGQISHLVILNAYPENQPGSAPLISLVDILKDRAERMLHAEIDLVNRMEHAKGVEIVGIAKFDGFLNAMKQITEEQQIDLVIIGTNGDTHPKMEVREDDPLYLIHQIGKPLFLVPQFAPL